jgi:Fe2+ transport system protein FeoA
MSRERTEPEPVVHELTEALWAVADTGIRIEDLRTASVRDDSDRVLRTLVELGLARIEGEMVSPTPKGRNLVARDVRALSRLSVGTWGRVVGIRTADPERLAKLSVLGVMPGAWIRLLQKRPAAVIQVSETRIALDLDVASEILVRAGRGD